MALVVTARRQCEPARRNIFKIGELTAQRGIDNDNPALLPTGSDRDLKRLASAVGGRTGCAR